jgi:hypothetical protein
MDVNIIRRKKKPLRNIQFWEYLLPEEQPILEDGLEAHTRDDQPNREYTAHKAQGK